MTVSKRRMIISAAVMLLTIPTALFSKGGPVTADASAAKLVSTYKEASGTFSDGLHWEYDASSGTLTVSGKGSIDRDDTWNYPWYDFTFDENFDEKITYNFEIKGIIIEEGITSIGPRAFADCYGLKSVSLPDSLKTMDDNAFLNCNSLKTVKIPKNLENLEFNRCTSLESISVDEANKHFSSDDGILFNKDKTKIIMYPIGRKGSTYVIPDGVKEISYAAFGASDRLESIEIPDSVETIGEYAFAMCSKLKKVVVPQSVSGIGMGAFDNCPSLESVTFMNPNCRFDRVPAFLNNGVKDSYNIYYDGIISGYDRSSAEKYAKESGYEFVSLGESPIKIEAERGDANEDGKVNVRDAAHIAKTLAQGKADTLPDSADFNGDGKVNVRDAAAIAKYLATGMI